MSRRVITARWVVPVVGPAIENGQVTIEHGSIVEVGHRGRSQAVDVDYGDAAILPGFVNAHTHLELTACRGLAPFRGSFAGWLRSVVMLQAVGGDEHLAHKVMARGLHESLQAGVTAIVDIGQGAAALEAWQASRAYVAGLLEVIGMGIRAHEGHPRAIRMARTILEGAAARTDINGSVGISPHAPYSTSPHVYAEAMRLARRYGVPIGTHLAETHEEAEFLARGTGPFRELLEDRGAWDGSFELPGCSPVEYAERLGLLACRPLLAHVNYVSDADISILARYECSAVYCPRTHRFFGHEPHRYRDMLAAGVNVCVGTDSLASNETLSVLDELRFLRREHPDVASDVLLEMGTIRGARAMGIDARTGSVGVGKWADLVVAEIGGDRAGEPVEGLLRGEGGLRAVYVRGEEVDLGA